MKNYLRGAQGGLDYVGGWCGLAAAAHRDEDRIATCCTATEAAMASAGDPTNTSPLREDAPERDVVTARVDLDHVESQLRGAIDLPGGAGRVASNGLLAVRWLRVALSESQRRAQVAQAELEALRSPAVVTREEGA